MTVAELIAKLRTLEPDSIVVVPGYEQGIDPVDTVQAVNVEWATTEPEDYEGLGRISPGGGTPAVLIASSRHVSNVADEAWRPDQA